VFVHREIRFATDPARCHDVEDATLRHPSSGEIPMTEPCAAGYYREDDCYYYVNSAGAVYYVSGPGELEPAWENVGPPLSDDAKPRTPIAEDLEAFERCRIAYNIPA
jgi:hypothetical protein